MEKQRVDIYAEQQILSGKSHQEVFDHIVATSHFKIHDIAEIVRKIPTPEKRKRYGLHNSFLLAVLALFILDKIIMAVHQINAGNSAYAVIILLFPLISILLFYGLLRYKRNVHLWTGFLMLFGGAVASFRLVSEPGLPAIFGAVITFIGAGIAFYLSVKLVSDYEMDNELLKYNPAQRENLIKFIDR